MLSVEEIRQRIAELTRGAGGDPALALAAAQQESGFDPTAVGDAGHSRGLFQEHNRGAGAGLSDAERSDVAGSTRRFLERVQRVIASGFRGTPGEIAAAAQRPADPKAYARAVDALYARYSSEGTGIGGGPVSTPQGDCPPGFVRRNGVCVIAITQRPTPGALPGETPGASSAVQSGRSTGATLDFGIPNPFDPLAAAIDRFRGQVGSGTREIAVAGTVLLIAGVLAYGGVRRVLD